MGASSPARRPGARAVLGRRGLLGRYASRAAFSLLDRGLCFGHPGPDLNRAPYGRVVKSPNTSRSLSEAWLFLIPVFGSTHTMPPGTMYIPPPWPRPAT